MTEKLFGRGPYGMHSVRRATGATTRQVRYWLATGLVHAVRDTGGRPGVPRLFTMSEIQRIRTVVLLLEPHAPCAYPPYGGRCNVGHSLQQVRDLAPMCKRCHGTMETIAQDGRGRRVRQCAQCGKAG